MHNTFNAAKTHFKSFIYLPPMPQLPIFLTIKDYNAYYYQCKHYEHQIYNAFLSWHVSYVNTLALRLEQQLWFI